MAKDTLVKSIHHEDYLLAPENEFNLDLFCVLGSKSFMKYE